MKSKLVLAVIACLVVTAAAQDLWGGESRKPRALVYALEGLGALSGVAGCGCLAFGAWGVCLGLGPMNTLNGEPASPIWYAAIFAVPASALAMPAAVGLGAAGVGRLLAEDGSPGGAVSGAYGGAVVGAGLAILGYYGSRRNDAAGIPFYVVGGLAIPAGAVIGYNTGIKREALGQGFEGRLQQPAVALTSVELPDHSVDYGVKVQLAGLKF